MRPEEAEFLRSYLLPQVRSEQAVTRRILAAIPDGRGEYRPHEKNWTALRLARHLAGTEMWFLHAIIHRQFVDGQGPPADVGSGSALAAWYEAQGARRVAEIEALTAEELVTPVDYLGLRNDPAVHYLSLAIRHTVCTIAGSCRRTCGRWGRRCRRSMWRAPMSRLRRAGKRLRPGKWRGRRRSETGSSQPGWVPEWGWAVPVRLNSQEFQTKAIDSRRNPGLLWRQLRPPLAAIANSVHGPSQQHPMSVGLSILPIASSRTPIPDEPRGPRRTAFGGIFRA